MPPKFTRALGDGGYSGQAARRMVDALPHFFLQRILEWLQLLRHSPGIGVFGLQVLDQFRIRLLAEPVVVVNYRGSMTNLAVFSFLRDGRNRRHVRLRRHITFRNQSRHDESYYAEPAVRHGASSLALEQTILEHHSPVSASCYNR